MHLGHAGMGRGERDRRPRGCLSGGRGQPGRMQGATAPTAQAGTAPPLRHLLLQPLPGGPVECGGGTGAACCQGPGAADGPGHPAAGWGAPVLRGSPRTRAARPPVSAQGLWQVQKEREHVPVSSSAVPLAPGRGYGLRGSGEGSWDGHPATLKQSEQKRWDETGRLVHEMKPSSPAGSAARLPRASLLAPALPQQATPPDQGQPSRSWSSGAQHRSGTTTAGKPSPRASVTQTILGGKRYPLDISVSLPGERSTQLKPQHQPSEPQDGGKPQLQRERLERLALPVPVSTAEELPRPKLPSSPSTTC